MGISIIFTDENGQNFTVREQTPGKPDRILYQGTDKAEALRVFDQATGRV
jgi:hypothetical protein